jgi:hypothetical protein
MRTAADRRFPGPIASAVHDSQIIGVRAGMGDHRIIGIWAVVVDGRIFVRSWSLKSRSWYRTFLEDPRGVMTVGDRTLKVRAVQTRGERLKDAVSQAYLDKYHTPGAIKFARDLGRAKSTGTTTELVPAASPKATRKTSSAAGSVSPGARKPRSRGLASRPG